MNKIILMLGFLFLLANVHSQDLEDELSAAEDYLESGDNENAYKSIERADKILSNYYFKYDKPGYITEQEKIDDDVIGDFYFVKGKILEKKGHTAKSIKVYLKLIDYEKGKIYRATQKDSRDYTYFKDKITLDKALNTNKYEDEKVYDIEYEKAEEVYDLLKQMRNNLVQDGAKLFSQNKYLEAKEKFIQSFDIGKDLENVVDTAILYNAYVCSQKLISDNAKDSALYKAYIKEAIHFLDKLINYGFTNINKVYRATRKETGKYQYFNTDGELRIAMLGKEYINDTIYVTPSIESNLYLYISKLSYDIGDYENSLKYSNMGINKFPKNVEIMQIKLKILSHQGRYDEFRKSVEKLLNNPNIKDKSIVYFNIGVANVKIGKLEEAKKSYIKAIEINKKYVDAYINLSVLILDEEKSINKEISDITYPYKNRKQRNRVKELEKKKKDIYKESLKYLESAYNNGAKSKEVLRTLKNIYYQLDMEDKMKNISQELKSMEE